jgi:hypothetical protein
MICLFPELVTLQALGALHHHHQWQNVTDANSQAPDTGQTGTAGSQTASAVPGTGGSDQVQATLAAQLGSPAALAGPLGDAGPSRSAGGVALNGQADSFRSNLGTVLQSVQSGDMTSAQRAATALRSALSSSNSPVEQFDGYLVYLRHGQHPVHVPDRSEGPVERRAIRRFDGFKSRRHHFGRR